MVMLDMNYRLEQEARRKRNAARIRKTIAAYRNKRMIRTMWVSERIIWIAVGAFLTAMGALLWQSVACS